MKKSSPKVKVKSAAIEKIGLEQVKKSSPKVKVKSAAIEKIGLEQVKESPPKVEVKSAAIVEIRLKQLRKSVQRYLNQKSKTNKQITRAKTIKDIKKSLNLAEKDESWDEEIWSFAIYLSKSIRKRTSPKTIYFQ